MDGSGPLDGVVAFLHARHQAGPVDPKLTLKRKLESLGARVCQRLAKETTHVVFQKQHQVSDTDLESEVVILQDLQERASKVLALTRQDWLSECLEVNLHHGTDECWDGAGGRKHLLRVTVMG